MALALRDLAPRRRPSTPPTLVVVQGRRRRITRMSVTVVGVIVIGLAVLGVLHTQIAERQWQIDQLERSISSAHEDFDTLRALRAELRSPERLNTAARELGMRPATASNFIPIDPQVLATTIAQTAMSPERSAEPEQLAPIDQFRLVKVIEGRRP
ncbi:MAG: hypothetical protein ACO20G_02275 [Ilumatobacteraceae bacterium]|nr:hypothetical protein [Actinomycetota bacterium]